MYVIAGHAPLEHRAINPVWIQVEHAVHPAIVVSRQAVVYLARRDGNNAAYPAQGIAAAVKQFFNPCA